MSDPIDPRFHDQMNALAHVIDGFFNGPEPVALPGLPTPKRQRDVGFFLAVFPFDEGGKEGRFNYISNAERLDVVTLLTEMRARFAGQPEVSGQA